MIFIVVLLQITVCLIASTFIRSYIQKIALFLCNGAFFLYSCYGIFIYNLDFIYYYSFIACFLAFNICFVIGDNLSNKLSNKTTVDGVLYGNKSDYFFQNYSQHLKWLALLYFIIRILWLVFPQNNLKYIFSSSNFIYSNTLEAHSLSVAHPVGKIFSTLSTIMLPFALVYICSQKNKKHIVFFFILDLYLQYLMGGGSIGRLSIIRNIIIVFLVLYLLETNQNKKRRYLIGLSAGALLSFVIYVVFENWRGGNRIGFFDIGLIDSIQHFVNSEFYYPKHYPHANSLHDLNVYRPMTFWAWLFTLPIPKVIFNIFFVDPYASITYRVYTYHYWGGHWGHEPGYAGQLLSVMGDGILAYGVHYAFIIVIPFALFVGFFLRYLLNIKNSEIMYCLMLFNFVISFRPGVQYGLAYINTFVGMILMILLFRVLPKEKKHTGVKNSIGDLRKV